MPDVLLQQKITDRLDIHVREIVLDGLSVVAEDVSKEICIHDMRKISLAAIITKTAPLVCIEMFDGSRAVFQLQTSPRLGPSEKIERIEVDVVQYVQKVRVGVDEDLFCASLEKRSHSFVALVEIFRIPNIELHKESRDADISNLGE
ncbi:MAG: hypothetical protein UT09_C0015G0009 [Parcubacteria group bacterium GW2011_GWF2_38_8]|nr:MAG: hypothetical protein UT09_C0015G0009 [Parcubacteria group bacterium GW2011_GWF2_38_8]